MSPYGPGATPTTFSSTAFTLFSPDCVSSVLLVLPQAANVIKTAATNPTIPFFNCFISLFPLFIIKKRPFSIIEKGRNNLVRGTTFNLLAEPANLISLLTALLYRAIPLHACFCSRPNAPSPSSVKRLCSFSPIRAL